MKKQEIRDRLNANPMEWDNEGVWDKINASEKKKRRLPFFWWGTGALFIGIGIFLGVFYDSSFDSKVSEADITNYNSANSKVVSSSSKKVDESTNRSEIIDLSDKKKAKYDGVTKGGVEAKIGEIKPLQIRNTTKSSNEYKNNGLENKSRTRQFAENKSTKKSTSSGSSYRNMDYNIVGSKITVSEYQNSQNSTIDKNIVANRQVIGFSSLRSSKINGLFLEVAKKNLQLPNINVLEQVVEKSKLQNEFQLSLGGVEGRHQFGESDVFDRSNLEKNKLGISGKIEYARTIGENWVISSGLNLMIHKTHFNRVVLSEDQYVNSGLDDKTYLVSKETTYDYYNYYAFADLDFGLGYQFSIGGINIIPTTGLGLNLFSFYDGDAIDEVGDVISLNDVYRNPESQKVYYYGRLVLSVNLMSGYTVGLAGEIQSKRKVFSTQKLHTINPVLLQIVFSKKW